MKNPKVKSGYLVTFLAALLFCLPILEAEGRAGNSHNGGGGKTSAAIPITSILNDTGTVANGTNYRVQSDNVSIDYFNEMSDVSSVLQASIGDWVLDTSASTTRAVLIDLRAPVPGSTTNPPFGGVEILPIRIIVQCSLELKGSFQAMSLNQTLACPMIISFTFGGTKYDLRMESNMLAPETNSALVTCTATSSGHCSAWTLNPVTQRNGSVQNIARLQQATNGPKFLNLGDFYVSFLFNITDP
jgi:hypothetical protein